MADRHRRELHARVFALSGCLAGLAGLIYLVVLPAMGDRGTLPGVSAPWWLLAAAFVVSERSVAWVRTGRDQGIGLTLSDVPILVGLFLVDPGTLLIARLIGSASNLVVRGRVAAHKDVFNLACHAFTLGLAEITWHLGVGDGALLGPRGWVAGVAALLVAELATIGAIYLAIWADTGRRDGSRLQLGWGEVVSAASACFGLVFVYVVSVDWRAGWLVLVVTAVLYIAHRSYAAAQRRTEDVESVSEFTSRLGTFTDVESVVAETLRTLTADLHATQAELYVENELAGTPAVWRLDLNAGDAVSETTLARSAIGRLDPPADAPLVLARNLATVRAALARRAGVRDAITVPVLREGVPVGTALVADRVDTVRTFSRSDLAQLQALANHAASALHNARLGQDLRAALAERERQATHDDLTGLANRRAFTERLDERCASGAPSLVVVIDLDRFHEINEVLGSTTGDLVLTVMAHRLERTYGAERVARLGSDEFAVVLGGGAEDVAGVVAHLRAEIRQGVVLGDLDLSPEISVGVAVLLPGEEAAAALAHADLALRRAKTTRAGLVVFDPALDLATADRLTMLSDLRHSLAEGSLGVHFQPQVRLSDGQVTGFEALARWTHPRRGTVPPDEFIEVAEQGGLMMDLTLVVLDRALAGLARWRSGPAAPGRDLAVSVNVSPRTLVDPDLLVQVARLLTRHGVPPDRLTIEITESDIMADPERAAVALGRYADLGVRLSIDDLGTGYSSLAYLSRFPLDELKIDKSFIFHLLEDPATEAVVDAVVGLGHRLGRTVVAEGVEDYATWARLRVLGADLAQGYLVARPLPLEQVAGWLATWGGVQHLAAVPRQAPAPAAEVDEAAFLRSDASPGPAR